MGKRKRAKNAYYGSKTGKADGGKDEKREKWVFHNDQFNEYYKKQGIVPDGEWVEFEDTLKRPLPSAFRINGSGKFAATLRSHLESRYSQLQGSIEIDGQKLEAPYKMPWYPDGLGWQFAVQKHMLKRHPGLDEFHKFLMSETNLGNISRQEAVSMIPPLLLQVQPHHLVLDMCAAPGSKTAQLVEALSSEHDDPPGVVIANDADMRRCHMLVHQLKRLNSPHLIVTNHDASFFPSLTIAPPLHHHLPAAIAASPPSTSAAAPAERTQRSKADEGLMFDRILCDVPCSGDGTMRKAPDLWRRWTSGLGIGMHRIQLKIAMRAAQLLKVGGLMVYSTCSFNPLENEAVLAEVLRRCEGALELVETTSLLPELIRSPGLSSWSVHDNRSNTWYSSYAQVAEKDHGRIHPSMFPPFDMPHLPLHRAMRVLPHKQDTGGFFIALLRKVRVLTFTGWGNQNYEARQQDAINADKHPDASPAPALVTRDDEPQAPDRAAPSPSPVPEASPDAEQADGSSSSSDVDPAAPEQPVAATLPPKHFRRRPAPQASVEGEEARSTRPRSQAEVESVIVLLPDAAAKFKPVAEYYGIRDTFPWARLFTKGEMTQNRIYIASSGVHAILTANNALPTRRLNIVYTGVEVLEANKGCRACGYRIVQEGLPLVAPHLSAARVVDIPIPDLTALLAVKDVPFDNLASDSLRQAVLATPEGCMLGRIHHPSSPPLDPSIPQPLHPLTALSGAAEGWPVLVICWRGRSCFSLFVSGSQKHLLRAALHIDKPQYTYTAPAASTNTAAASTGCPADATAAQPTQALSAVAPMQQ